jgi:LysR family glycine cleavage system transcriptional activator
MIARDLARHHAAEGRIAIPEGLAVRHDQAHYLLLPRRSRAPSAEALMLRDWLIRTFAEPA